MQIVVGSVAGSKWMGDDLFEHAASKGKHVHIVEGSNHMDLYDGAQYVDEAAGVLAPFEQSPDSAARDEGSARRAIAVVKSGAEPAGFYHSYRGEGLSV